jgi:hypothetical protein
VPAPDHRVPGDPAAEPAVVDSDGAVLRFDSDRPGEALVARLVAVCAVTGAVEVPSDEPAATRYERVEHLGSRLTATRTYLFPGGCLVERFQVDAAQQAEFGGAAAAMVGLVGRQLLHTALEQHSGGRLHLDPDAPP